MATLTVAKSSHRLFAELAPPFTPLPHPKVQPEFRVFATGEAEYHWRVAASATNQTISRHKSLSFAIRKCTRLNKQRSEGAKNETN